MVLLGKRQERERAAKESTPQDAELSGPKNAADNTEVAQAVPSAPSLSPSHTTSPEACASEVAEQPTSKKEDGSIDEPALQIDPSEQNAAAAEDPPAAASAQSAVVEADGAAAAAAASSLCEGVSDEEMLQASAAVETSIAGDAHTSDNAPRQQGPSVAPAAAADQGAPSSAESKENEEAALPQAESSQEERAPSAANQRSTEPDESIARQPTPPASLQESSSESPDIADQQPDAIVQRDEAAEIDSSVHIVAPAAPVAGSACDIVPATDAQQEEQQKLADAADSSPVSPDSAAPNSTACATPSLDSRLVCPSAHPLDVLRWCLACVARLVPLHTAHFDDRYSGLLLGEAPALAPSQTAGTAASLRDEGLHRARPPMLLWRLDEMERRTVLDSAAIDHRQEACVLDPFWAFSLSCEQAPGESKSKGDACMHAAMMMSEGIAALPHLFVEDRSDVVTDCNWPSGVLLNPADSTSNERVALLRRQKSHVDALLAADDVLARCGGVSHPAFTGRPTAWLPFAPVATVDHFLTPYYSGWINFAWQEVSLRPEAPAWKPESARDAHVRPGSVVRFRREGTEQQGLVLLTYVRLSTSEAKRWMEQARQHLSDLPGDLSTLDRFCAAVPLAPSAYFVVAPLVPAGEAAAPDPAAALGWDATINSAVADWHWHLPCDDDAFKLLTRVCAADILAVAEPSPAHPLWSPLADTDSMQARRFHFHSAQSSSKRKSVVSLPLRRVDLLLSQPHVQKRLHAWFNNIAKTLQGSQASAALLTHASSHAKVEQAPTNVRELIIAMRRCVLPAQPQVACAKDRMPVPHKATLDSAPSVPAMSIGAGGASQAAHSSPAITRIAKKQAERAPASAPPLSRPTRAAKLKSSAPTADDKPRAAAKPSVKADEAPSSGSGTRQPTKPSKQVTSSSDDEITVGKSTKDAKAKRNEVMPLFMDLSDAETNMRKAPFVSFLWAKLGASYTKNVRDRSRILEGLQRARPRALQDLQNAAPLVFNLLYRAVHKGQDASEVCALLHDVCKTPTRDQKLLNEQCVRVVWCDSWRFDKSKRQPLVPDESYWTRFERLNIKLVEADAVPPSKQAMGELQDTDAMKQVSKLQQQLDQLQKDHQQQQEKQQQQQQQMEKKHQEELKKVKKQLEQPQSKSKQGSSAAAASDVRGDDSSTIKDRAARAASRSEVVAAAELVTGETRPAVPKVTINPPQRQEANKTAKMFTVVPAELEESGSERSTKKGNKEKEKTKKKKKSEQRPPKKKGREREESSSGTDSESTDESSDADSGKKSKGKEKKKKGKRPPKKKARGEQEESSDSDDQPSSRSAAPRRVAAVATVVRPLMAEVDTDLYRVPSRNSIDASALMVSAAYREGLAHGRSMLPPYRPAASDFSRPIPASVVSFASRSLLPPPPLPPPGFSDARVHHGSMNPHWHTEY
jgi:hypothetical protein